MWIGKTTVAFAAVAVKGLRFAPMNGHSTPALDRHPRYGCIAAMRRMSSSHVSHGTSDGDAILPASEARRLKGMKGSCVAHRAVIELRHLP